MHKALFFMHDDDLFCRKKGYYLAELMFKSDDIVLQMGV